MEEKAEEIGDSYFHCSDNERAAFELGIKLGALFHQFIGAPLSSDNIEVLERAIEKTIESQAFVKRVDVHIIPKLLDIDSVFHEYTTLSGDMLDARVIVEFKDIEVQGRLRYVEELDYPLMYIESITLIGDR
ncbi:MAG: dihydroneopterin aldolase family protein [Thermoplasmata archaeon]